MKLTTKDVKVVDAPVTSEVFNTDCLEYMRTLPDKAFQLAIADPRIGHQKTIRDAYELRETFSHR